MTKTPSAQKRPVGRPPALKLDESTLSLITGLGSIWATYEECAAVLNVDVHTFERFRNRHAEVKEAFDRGKQTGLVSLRRAQFKKAIQEGNPTMLIWLGKQLLGQSDKIDTTVDYQPGISRKYRMTDDELLEIATGNNHTG